MEYIFGQLTNQTITDWQPKEISAFNFDDQTAYHNPILTLENDSFKKGQLYQISLDVEEYRGEDPVLRFILHNPSGPVMTQINFGTILHHNIIFSPQFDSSKIIFKDETENWIRNKHFSCSVYKIPDLLSSSKVKSWLKFGYYGRPGGTIIVNHVPVMIGRSGMYQLINGIRTKAFSILPNADGEIDAFVLDYMGKEEKK